MLSPKAQNIIKLYNNLPFKDIKGVTCPYFNQKRRLGRGQLRVLAGKGTPQEIVEEAKITSIQYGHEMFDYHGNCLACGEKKAQQIKHYLVEQDLGIDCSGYVVHILRQHFLETKNIDFVKNICIVPTKKIIRYLITKIRPIENINVKVLADDKNSVEIKKITDIKPADFIIMLAAGLNKKRDHILLVTDVKDDKIHYTQARAWTSDGQYNHGVSAGSITITDKNKGLLQQKWEESNKKSNENETYLEAKSAHTLKIKRLKI